MALGQTPIVESVPVGPASTRAWSQHAPLAVVVTFNGGHLLRRCIESLQAQTQPPKEIIVVISRASGVDVPDGVRVVQLQQDTGFAPAVNAGLPTRPDRCVLVLNDDTEAEADFIQTLMEAAEQGPEGVYQPRIELADGTGRMDNAGHRLFLDGFNLPRARGRAVGRTELTDEAGAFSGAAALFTPATLTQTGGFDGDLEAYGEDIDLSLRLLRRGFRVHYVPKAIIRHELGASYGRHGAHKVYLVERNRMRAALRSLPWSALATMPGWTAMRLACLGMAAATGRGPGARIGLKGIAATVAGAAAGLAMAPEALRKRKMDAPEWTLGERQMWRVLVRNHVRLEDLRAQW